MGIEIFKMSTGGGGLLLVGGVPLSATLTAITDQFGNVSPLQIATASVRMTAPTFLTLPNWTNTLGSKDGFFASQSINVPSAGNGVFRMIRNDYTINNTGAQTGTVTGIFQNAIETNLNGIISVYMDLQRNSASIFKIQTDTGVTATSLGANFAYFQAVATGYIGFQTRTLLDSASDGVLRMSNYSGTTFNRLQFGGTTNSFPSIKRNGAAIDFRLADDSGYCNVVASSFQASGNGGYSVLSNDTPSSFAVYNANNVKITNFNGVATEQNASFTLSGALFASSGIISPSARVQIDSTNKGFLMPRMTETQITTIASPADGLMVYNTTIQAPCFYNGLTMQWQKISHSIM